MNGASSGSTSTSDTSALMMRVLVWATNSSIEESRMGSGSTTTVAPVSQIAWIAVASGREVGPRSATWSPGPTPFAWRLAA